MRPCRQEGAAPEAAAPWAGPVCCTSQFGCVGGVFILPGCWDSSQAWPCCQAAHLVGSGLLLGTLGCIGGYIHPQHPGVHSMRMEGRAFIPGIHTQLTPIPAERVRRISPAYHPKRRGCVPPSLRWRGHPRRFQKHAPLLIPSEVPYLGNCCQRVAVVVNIDHISDAGHHNALCLLEPPAPIGPSWGRALRWGAWKLARRRRLRRRKNWRRTDEAKAAPIGTGLGRALQCRRGVQEMQSAVHGGDVNGPPATMGRAEGTSLQPPANGKRAVPSSPYVLQLPVHRLLT